MSERPIECGECKRPSKVIYKEILGTAMSCTSMCEECPLLKSKLHGNTSYSKKNEGSVCCGVCGTALESVTMGQPLGCAQCYTVFGEELIRELVEGDGIPSSLKKKVQAQKLTILHMGRTPEQTESPVLSSKLASLNEALNEALKKENYEQAATLRDQIKALTDQHDSTA